MPWWMWAGIVPIAAYLAFRSSPYFDPERFGWTVGPAFCVRLALMFGSLVWASQRADLPLRFRFTLRTLGSISGVSCALMLVEIATEGRIPPEWTEWLGLSWFLLSYVCAVVAIWCYPCIQHDRRQTAVLIADSIVTVGGLGVLLWIGITMPAIAAGADADAIRNQWTRGVISLLILVLLNRLVLQGQAIPSRRAFWWFVAGQSAYLPSQVLDQLAAPDNHFLYWGEVCYVLGVIPTMVAAVLIRATPLTRPPTGGGPSWFQSFNPLPLLVPATLALFLLKTVVGAQQQRVTVLGTALVVASMLLAARMLISAYAHARLLQRQAHEEIRVQEAKMAAISRLAGGVAHEFNNLMTVVISHADLGRDALPSANPALEDFRAIREAGERAATLTNKLLHFSGKQFDGRRTLDLREFVGGLADSIRSQAGPGTRVEFALDPVSPIAGDPRQLEQLIGEIVKNARAALPAANRHIRVSVETVALSAQLETPFLSVAPGRYVGLSIVDSGHGIAPDALPRIFDPFFSTKPMHEASGLGLASVYGIVARHRGGIDVESSPGQGTCVRCLFPTGENATPALRPTV